MINAGRVGARRWGQTQVRSEFEKSVRIRITRGATRTPSNVVDFAAEMGITITDDYEALLAS